MGHEPIRIIARGNRIKMRSGDAGGLQKEIKQPDDAVHRSLRNEKQREHFLSNPAATERLQSVPALTCHPAGIFGRHNEAACPPSHIPGEEASFSEMVITDRLKVAVDFSYIR